MTDNQRPSTACSSDGRDGRTLLLRQSASAMGTTFSVALHGRARDEMEAAVQAAFGELRRLDRLLSNYRVDSEWSLVNREAAQRPVAVCPELFGLLTACLELSDSTDGAFDITVGPLKRAWGFHRGHGAVPPVETLASARTHVGHRLVSLNPSALTVRFDHPGVEIDPGGIGKGYAVDRMVAILRQRGFDSALVSGARSSVYGLGSPPGGSDGWRAEVCDPERPGTCVANALLNDTALSTSGTSERFCLSDATMYSDIVDPRTGWPLQTVTQASVITTRAFEGEAWAKACLLNGEQWVAGHKPDDCRILFCCGKSLGRPLRIDN